MQALLNTHNFAIESLLDSVLTFTRVLNASSGYFYDKNADTICLPKAYTIVDAKGLICGSSNKDYPHTRFNVGCP